LRSRWSGWHIRLRTVIALEKQSGAADLHEGIEEAISVVRAVG
jgi:hypothetical protein